MNALFRQDRLEIIAEVSFSLNPTASAITGWTYMKLRQNGTVSFLIRLADFQTRGGALMKLRLAGKVKRLNVEHRILQRRTVSIERPTLMTLSFI